MSKRQERYGNLVRGWDFRTTPDLLEAAEEAREKLGISKTEFLEEAILDKVNKVNINELRQKIGKTIYVKPYKRLRTIFENAEHTPGKWQDFPGYIGKVDQILEDADEITVIVKHYDTRAQSDSYIEHSLDELNI